MGRYNTEKKNLKNYNSVGKIPKSNIKIVERDKIDTFKNQKHPVSLIGNILEI
jgi:hypothetical protein